LVDKGRRQGPSAVLAGERDRGAAEWVDELDRRAIARSEAETRDNIHEDRFSKWKNNEKLPNEPVNRFRCKDPLMTPEPLIFLCTSDISGKLRGKAVPARRAESGKPPSVGWTPTNVQITCFDGIADSPYGAFGDLVLIADLASRVRIDFGDGGPAEDFVIGDVVHLDGRPWECCTRAILSAALNRLKSVAGLTLVGAFEHEFHIVRRGGPRGEAFTLAGFRSERRLAETVVGGLAAAGIEAETILREYGPDQFEATVTPAVGITIADQAAALREIVRACGERLGCKTSFAPLIEPGGIGNGVHIHLSFRDAAGRPATYDPGGPHGMAKETGAFIAGVLRHLPAILPFLAPSVISYHRLVPHRWSAAFNNLGAQDREAAIRLCPVRKMGKADPAEQFNFEIRACDAAASPHLALAAIVHAGAAGIEAGLPAPAATEEDLSLLPADALTGLGLRRLPTSLGAALDEFEAANEVRGWFPDGFAEIYVTHKRHETASLTGLDDAALCAAYQEVY
jgi:glutamine synthetase